MIAYQGKSVYMGRYNTLEQATLVNTTARKILTVDEGAKLTHEEIDSNIKSAKEAVSNAISGLNNDGDATEGQDSSASSKSDDIPIGMNQATSGCSASDQTVTGPTVITKCANIPPGVYKGKSSGRWVSKSFGAFNLVSVLIYSHLTFSVYFTLDFFVLCGEYSLLISPSMEVNVTWELTVL